MKIMLFEKIMRWGKHHLIFSILFVYFIFVAGWVLIEVCLNPVYPQMFYPRRSLIDGIAMHFIEYPKRFPDTHLVWGNGRIRLGDLGAFSDYKHMYNQDVNLIDAVNTREETVTFDDDFFFGGVSVFRYKGGIIYAYSQKYHLFIMIDVKPVQYTYVNKPENLPSPHREEFTRLLSGSRGNYTFGEWDGNGHRYWKSDPDSTFSDVEDIPPLKEKKESTPEVSEKMDKKSLVPEITNSIGMKLKLIPAGTFMMGSLTTEEGRKDDETLHEVVLSQPFYMGAFEVTVEEYNKIMGQIPMASVPMNEKNTRRFVDGLMWARCDAFCIWLSEREPGMHYRLPTEAEWEYACRAGTTTPYFWGTNKDDPYISNSQLNLDQVREMKSPNPWGLYNMAGGVGEWCWDAYGDYPAERSTDPQGAPYETAQKMGRVYRGEIGSRSAARYHALPESKIKGVGFRVVAVPVEE